MILPLLGSSVKPMLEIVEFVMDTDAAVRIKANNTLTVPVEITIVNGYDYLVSRNPDHSVS